MQDHEFWARVNITTFDACWPWLGKVNRGGYGYTSRRNWEYSAHRQAFSLVKGPIPKSEKVTENQIMHTCDNRICCNPRHLRMGTLQQNMADMVSKSRNIGAHSGTRNGNAKLNFCKAAEIRASSLTQVQAAKAYGVSQSTVQRIRAEVSWTTPDQ